MLALSVMGGSYGIFCDDPQHCYAGGTGLLILFAGCGVRFLCNRCRKMDSCVEVSLWLAIKLQIFFRHFSF